MVLRVIWDVCDVCDYFMSFDLSIFSILAESIIPQSRSDLYIYFSIIIECLAISYSLTVEPTTLIKV